MLHREKTPLFFFDAGGLLFADPWSSANEADSASLHKARTILKAMEIMRPDALGLAIQDLAGGLQFLQKYPRMPWLAANLNTANGRQVTAPYRLKEQASLRMGIIGLMGESAPPQAGMVVIPWRQVLPQLLSGLGGKADLLILLSSYPESVNRTIAQENPDIHLLLQAGPGGTNKEPELINNTLLCRTGSQGKYLGLLDIHWNSSRTWQKDPQMDLLQAQKQQQALLRRIKRLQRSLPTNRLANDTGYQLLIKDEQLIRKTIDRLLATTPEKEKKSLCRYSNRFIPLDGQIQDNKPVRAVLDHYKRTIQKRGNGEDSETIGVQ